MKLSKTEARILAALNERGRYGASCWSGRGAEGGKVRGGQREFDACMSLAKKGLADLVGPPYRSIHTRRGWSIHSADVVIVKKGSASS